MTDSGSLTDVQDIAVTVTDENEAPSITSNGGGATAAVNAAENQTSVTDVESTDAEDSEGSGLTYSITGGADSGKFSIVESTGVLTFASAPDFENPTDAGANNVYDVQVTVTDSGSLTDVQDIAVTVTDENEAPTITSNGGGSTAAVNAAENQTSVTDVESTDAEDSEGSGLTYSITGGADSGKFSIVESTGVLTFASAPDFENPTDAGANNVYDVQVMVTDSGSLTDVQDIAVTVTDENEAPSITSNGGGATAAVNAAENQTSVTDVESTDAEDSEGSGLTYSITGGADSGKFSIVESTGVLTFASAPDFENPTDAGANNVYDVQVTVTDSGSLTDVQTITVTVTDENEAPSINTNGGGDNASVSVYENQTDVTTVDADDSENDELEYSITGGADSAKFDIGSESGDLDFVSAPDYEDPTDTDTNNTYIVEVTVSDGGLTDSQAITVTVLDVNEAPDITTDGGGSTAAVNAAENQSDVTTVDADDPEDDDLEYSITGGADSSKFEIGSESGDLDFASAPDYEDPTDAATNNTYIVEVTVTDNGSPNLTDIQTITVTVTDANEYPGITSNGGGDNASVSIYENETEVTTVDASDPENGELEYSITGGADSSKFTIGSEDGGLDFSSAPDYENPTDADQDNDYIVEVTVTDDGNPNLTDSQTITVTVLNVNEQPTDIALGFTNINENQAAGTIIGLLSTSDPDAGDSHTYDLVSGTGDTDNASFAIDVASLKTAEKFDYETKTQYSIRIRTTDNGQLYHEEIFTIDVNDINENPSDIALGSNSVDENESSGAAVGTFSTEDVDDGDTFTYEMVSGDGDTNNSLFSIDGDELQTGDSFDHETKERYSVRVRTTDSGGFFNEEAFFVWINDVNEVPDDLNLTGSSVDENEPSGTAVGTFSSVDVDDGDSHTYTLEAGEGDDDNASFSIDGDVLKTGDSFDYESKNSYSVRIRTTDSGSLYREEAYTITVIDVNEQPTDLAISSNTVPENAPDDTVVGDLTTTDVDAGDSHTYTIEDGNTDSIFGISGGYLVVADNTNLDRETTASYTLTIRTTDSGGLWYEEQITITIEAENEAPTDIDLSSNSVDENEDSGTAVGTLSTTDPDYGDTFTYSLVSGTGDTDNVSFAISGDELQTAESFDFETKNSYSVRIRTTDSGGFTYEEAFNVSVNDVNEVPDDLALDNADVDENENSGTAVGTFSTTDVDAGDSHTYSLVSGDGDTDNGSFTISGSELQTAASFDYETKHEFSIRVRTTDSGSLYREEAFIITVNDVNETPTDIAITNDTLPENAPDNLAVGTFSTTDVDAGDSHTYTIEGGNDDGVFGIDGDSLVVADGGSLDRNTTPSYTLTIRTTDSGDLWYEEQVIITVNDVNNAPTDIALSSDNVDENEPADTTVGTLSTTDTDGGDSHAYELVSGTGDTNNGSFSIDGTALKTGASFDHETKDSYSVRIRSTDLGGLSTEKAFIILVNDVNEVPTDLALSSSDVDENEPSGTAVGTFLSTDVDDGDSHTYTLVAGDGDDDNGSFAIDGNALETGAYFDYETKNEYSVRIRTTDSGSLYYEESCTITVNDVNETPTDLSISSNSVPENAPDTTVVGTFSTTDVDTGDSHTYSIEGGNTGGVFGISGSDLFVADGSTLDQASTPSYTLTIRTTDSGGLWYDEPVTITISDINNASTDLALTSENVDENQAAGTTVGTFITTDADGGDTHTYSLVEGEGDDDNALFAIDGIALETAQSFNHEAIDSYSIRLRTTDAGGFYYEEAFTILINDVNETPTDIALDSASVDENEPADTAVGTLSTSDVDDGDTHTYSLVEGDGDDDNASFTIADAVLKTAGMFDHEAKDEYSARVRSTDSGGLKYEEIFTITVENVDELPTVENEIPDQQATEDEAFSYTFPENTFNEPDGDELTYTATLADGSPLPDWLNFDPDTRTFSGTPGNDDTGEIDIKVTAEDGDENEVSDVFKLTVAAVNDAPEVTAGGTISFLSTDTQGKVVDSGVTVTDQDNDNLTGGTVEISSGFTASEDVLAAAEQGGITVVYDNQTGILVLTGTASLAEYQALLRAVTYQNTNAINPDETTRVVTYRVTDGELEGSDTATVMVDDVTPPYITDALLEDTGDDGYPDKITFTWSEPLAPGQEDLSDWKLLDGDGATDLLEGLTDDAVTIEGNKVIITLHGDRGSMDDPMYAYDEDEEGGGIMDVADNPGVEVDAGNTPPVAVIADIEPTPPTLVRLDGSESYDPDGQALIYEWTQVDGPDDLGITGATIEEVKTVPRAKGDYTIKLTVEDPFGASDYVTATLTITNADPTADAGRDRTIDQEEGDVEVTLDGSGSTDSNDFGDYCDIISYQWIQTEGPQDVTIVQESTESPIATFETEGLPPGTYVFKLIVTDGDGATDEDTVTIIISAGVANIPPTADAGVDIVAERRTRVTLTGHESKDTDGDPLTYVWSQIWGPNVNLSDVTSVQPSFTPTAPNSYRFGLVVNDGIIDSPMDIMDVFVIKTGDEFPVAEIVLRTPDGDVNVAALSPVGEEVVLDGSVLGITNPQSIRYEWTQLSGAEVVIADPSLEDITVVPVEEGVYYFRLDAYKGSMRGRGAEIEFTVFGVNTPPIADAGEDLMDEMINTEITLDGTGSFDADNDPIEYIWTQTLGPTVPVTNQEPAAPSFTPRRTGVYEFSLSIFDGTFYSNVDSVYIVVHSDSNRVPVAIPEKDALEDYVGTRVIMNGLPSFDEDAADNLIYQWIQVAGPPVIMDDYYSPTPAFIPPVIGIYIFEIYVDDGNDRSIGKTVTVNILPVGAPATPQNTESGPNSFSCFVATAAYGTPLARDVEVLREFRDCVLLSTEPGQGLVRTYYRYSPPLAKAISRDEALRSFTRTLLSPVVRSLELME